MRLGVIVAALDRAGLLVQAPPETGPEITGLTSDSRKVARGMLFCAVRGAVQDGHRFVPAAAAAGAAAALVEQVQPAPLAQVVVRDGRRAAAVAAETWFERPATRICGSVPDGSEQAAIADGWLRAETATARQTAAAAGQTASAR